MDSTLFHVPVAIKAKTDKALSEAMLKNQVSKHMYIRYFNIGFQNGEWVAWYLADMEKTLLNKINKAD